MFTKIQTLNDQAMVTGTALRKMILEILPQKITEQMHTVDLTGTTDQDIISIITTAGRTAEKWEAASKNCWLKGSLQLYHKKYPKRERSRDWTERPDRRPGLRWWSPGENRKNLKKTGRNVNPSWII
jgi:hypothetical protein